MNRYVNIAMAVAVITGAAAVYQLKYASEEAAGRVAELKRKVQFEKETIALLKAEWSLLNQPPRLQKLVENHQEQLGLVPLAMDQLGALNEIPDRPIRPAAAEETTASIPKARDPIAKLLSE